MYKCLITGGAGFIGSHLAEHLVGGGHSVRVLDDFATGHLKNLDSIKDRVEILRGSVADADAVARAVSGCEVVYHLAALPSVVQSVENPVLAHEIAATGTVRTLDAARKAGVRRLVFAASSSAYGDQPGAVRKEDDLLMPLSPYAAAKLAGEHYCSAFAAVYGLETVRLRFFNVFGPRQDPKSPYSGVIALFSAAMTQGKTPTIYGDGLQSRDFVYVADVVQALTKAAETPGVSGNVYNVGRGESVTILDLVRALNKLLGQNIQPQHGPPRAGDVRYSEADISRIKADLKYEPRVTFEEGLARTLKAV